MQGRLPAWSTTQKTESGLPDGHGVYIIAPVVIACNLIRLDVDQMRKGRFQLLLATFIQVEVLQPELTAFFVLASRLHKGTSPFFYRRHIFIVQMPEGMTAKRIQFGKLGQLI